MWKLTTELSEEPWGQDLWLHSILGDREQWKCVLRGKKSFWGPQQVCAPLLFAGLQTELSRQPPALLLGSSSSPSDHLLGNQSQLRQHLTALVQDSDASCLLPGEPELKDFFGWLCLQLCLESSQSTSKCSVLVVGWAAGLNFTGEVSSQLPPPHLMKKV